jgi:hypothetical protein
MSAFPTVHLRVCYVIHLSAGKVNSSKIAFWAFSGVRTQHQA